MRQEHTNFFSVRNYWCNHWFIEGVGFLYEPLLCSTISVDCDTCQCKCLFRCNSKSTVIVKHVNVLEKMSPALFMRVLKGVKWELDWAVFALGKCGSSHNE
mgnify:CR=1 FL=1